MKIDVLSYEKEVELIGDVEVKSGEAKIDPKNIGFFISLLSKVYSDRFGSIVREITSNCYDAHVRVGKPDTPIIIRKFVDSTSQHYIEFSDEGSGISPTTLDDIYMSYGESDKRGTNGEHGGFGLGSKSPLSYTSYFHLITRVNGVEYTYLMNESIKGVTYDLLNSEETEKGNGTTIRIPISKKSEYNDTTSFGTAISKQLKYFTTVFVEGFDVENNYKIHDFKSFKIREDLFLGYHHNPLHLTHGMATYPINFDLLGIKPINFNAALKFDIGELDVIINREQLEYTPKTIKALKDKIETFQKEFKETFLKSYFIESDLRMFFLKKLALTSHDKSLILDVVGNKINISLSNLPFIEERELYYSINDTVLSLNKMNGSLMNGSLYNLVFKVIKLKLKLSADAFTNSLTKTGVDAMYKSPRQLLEGTILSLKKKGAYRFGTGLKRNERTFLNDSCYHFFYEFDDSEETINELFEHYFTPINNIINDQDYLRHEFRKQLIETLTSNKTNIDSLKIPSNYGVEKSEVVRKESDEVLYYVYGKGQERMTNTFSSFESEDTLYIYFNNNDELGYRILINSMFDCCDRGLLSKKIEFIKCATKYHKELCKFKNCIHVSELDRLKELFRYFIMHSHFLLNADLVICDLKYEKQMVIEKCGEYGKRFIECNDAYGKILNEDVLRGLKVSYDVVERLSPMLFTQNEVDSYLKTEYKKEYKIVKSYKAFYNYFMVEMDFISSMSYMGKTHKLYNPKLEALELNLKIKKTQLNNFLKQVKG